MPSRSSSSFTLRACFGTFRFDSPCGNRGCLAGYKLAKELLFPLPQSKKVLL